MLGPDGRPAARQAPPSRPAVKAPTALQRASGVVRALPRLGVGVVRRHPVAAGLLATQAAGSALAAGDARSAGTEAAGLAGGLGGAAAGAALGTLVAGPVGTVLGSLIGGLAGDALARAAGRTLFAGPAEGALEGGAGADGVAGSGADERLEPRAPTSARAASRRRELAVREGMGAGEAAELRAGGRPALPPAPRVLVEGPLLTRGDEHISIQIATANSDPEEVGRVVNRAIRRERERQRREEQRLLDTVVADLSPDPAY